MLSELFFLPRIAVGDSLVTLVAALDFASVAQFSEADTL